MMRDGVDGLNSISILTIGVLLFSAGSPAKADGCRDFMRQLEPYERQVKEAIRDEPEDLPKEVERHAKAVARSQPERAKRIDEKIRRGLIRLQRIDPPSSLAPSHRGLIAYYRAGVAALDAQAKDQTARDAAELDLWIGLKGYFTDVRDVLVANECMSGDVEAIENDLMPLLDQRIDELRGQLSTP